MAYAFLNPIKSYKRELAGRYNAIEIEKERYRIYYFSTHEIYQFKLKTMC